MTALSERTNFQRYGSFSGAGDIITAGCTNAFTVQRSRRALGHGAFTVLALYWNTADLK